MITEEEQAAAQRDYERPKLYDLDDHPVSIVTDLSEDEDPRSRVAMQSVLDEFLVRGIVKQLDFEYVMVRVFQGQILTHPDLPKSHPILEEARAAGELSPGFGFYGCQVEYAVPQGIACLFICGLLDHHLITTGHHYGICDWSNVTVQKKTPTEPVAISGGNSSEGGSL